VRLASVAVIGIIARSPFSSPSYLGEGKLLWGTFAALAVSTAWTSREVNGSFGWLA